jgi:hypothetical protein
MDTCRLVLPPAESDFVEMANAPDPKLAPVPLPIDRTTVFVPVVVVLTPVAVSPVMELESPPQPVSNAAPSHTMIDNLRMLFNPSFADSRPWQSVQIGSLTQNLRRDENQKFCLVVDVDGALEQVDQPRDVR